MFCDIAKIKVIAGKGGDGAATFHREKFIQKGGPDGGDGGKGGDIYIIADQNENTLASIVSQKIYRAENGKNGSSNNRTGASGSDLMLKVPVGTIIKTLDGALIADLAQHNDKFLIARGGIGGKGNTHFKSSIRQAPNFAEKGEPGEEKEIILEVRLIADIGIIGLPSAGKSSLISLISNAKPKIAPYPFTTLSPNLGKCDLQSIIGEPVSLVFADIPGLIEGASTGKGLGHEFLRHIMRTRVLVHIIDITLPDLVNAYKTINKELKIYGNELDKKPQIVVLNKIDLMPEEDAEKIAKKFAQKTKITPVLISCATGKNIPDFLKNLYHLYKKFIQQKQTEPSLKKPEEYKVFRPYETSEKRFKIILLKPGFFEIENPLLERMVKMTNFKNIEAVNRLRHHIKKLGIERALIKQGVNEGDTIIISGVELTFKKSL